MYVHAIIIHLLKWCTCLTLMFAVICTNSEAQFQDLQSRLKAKQDRIDAIVMGIKPVLDYIDPVPEAPQTSAFGYRPPRADAIMERCKDALTHFKEFTRGAAISAAGHALAVVRSLYSSVFCFLQSTRSPTTKDRS